MTELFFIPN